MTEKSEGQNQLILVALVVLTFLPSFAFALAIIGNPGPYNFIFWPAVIVAMLWLGVHRFPRREQRSLYLLSGFVAGVIFLLTIAFANMNRHPKVALRSQCLMNVKQLAVGMVMYAADYDDNLPPASRWLELNPEFKKDISRAICPTSHQDPAYALNQDLTLAAISKQPDPEKAVMLFESTAPSPNPTGGPTTFNPAHVDKGVLAFLDGHAKFVDKPTALAQKWK